MENTTTTKKAWYLRLFMVFALMGPAIIAGTANNDAGGISTYAFAGSQFGYLLLWVLTLNFITLAFTQEMGIRLGTFTGKGLAALIRERFGVRWTFFALTILLIANVAVAVGQFAGIAAALEIFNISKYFTIPFFSAIIWLVLYKGDFKKVEKIFLTISLFFLVYIVSAVMAKPDWIEVARESITPHISFDPLYFYALLGVMGTTITPWGQFFIQSYVVDKGVDKKHYKFQKLEAVIASFFACFIAAMIIITTKQTLFDNGIVVDSAESAALALVPILGDFAKNIFGIGFLFAALLGAFILPLTTSYSICEALGFEHGMDTDLKDAKIFYGIILFVIVFSAAFVLIPGVPLFKTMIAAQVLNGILLPIILIFLMILVNSWKRLGLPEMGKFGKIVYNLVGWEAVIRLSLISILLVAFTLFPQLMDSLKSLF